MPEAWEIQATVVKEFVDKFEEMLDFKNMDELTSTFCNLIKELPGVVRKVDEYYVIDPRTEKTIKKFGNIVFEKEKDFMMSMYNLVLLTVKFIFEFKSKISQSKKLSNIMFWNDTIVPFLAQQMQKTFTGLNNNGSVLNFKWFITKLYGLTYKPKSISINTEALLIKLNNIQF